LSKPFTHRLRVRYSEIDGQKFVFNANYAVYVDICNTEYFRMLLGDEWVKKPDFEPVLAKLTIEYKRPAKLDDILDITCRVIKIGRTSWVTHYEIWRGEELMTTAETVQVCIDLETETAQPLPKNVREKMIEFEKITE